MIPESFREVSDRLDERIRRQLLAKYESEVQSAAEPCIRLLTFGRQSEEEMTAVVFQARPELKKDDDSLLATWREIQREKLPLGRSRIGGVPDLPASISWPMNSEGNKLHLAAQLECAKLPVVPGCPLPARGWLYFFVENSDREFPLPCRVFHYDGPVESLVRAGEAEVAQIAPSDGSREPQVLYPIEEAIVSFDLPGAYGDRGGFALDENEKLDDAFYQASDKLGGDRRIAKLFGYGGFRGMTSSEIAQEYGEREGDDWMLLLRVHCHHGWMGMVMWLGDNDLDVYIRRSDLFRGDFSNCYATST